MTFNAPEVHSLSAGEEKVGSLLHGEDGDMSENSILLAHMGIYPRGSYKGHSNHLAGGAIAKAEECTLILIRKIPSQRPWLPPREGQPSILCRTGTL